MKVIIQRVLNAKCVVNEENVSEITSGMMLLVGFTNGDSVEQIDKMVKKIINLRIFEDENKKMNLSIQKVNGEILSISQFTLYANL
jgi:D-tyrosyl-tRNA(Tyr) deacylase